MVKISSRYNPDLSRSHRDDIGINQNAATIFHQDAANQLMDRLKFHNIVDKLFNRNSNNFKYSADSIQKINSGKVNNILNIYRDIFAGSNTELSKSIQNINLTNLFELSIENIKYIADDIANTQLMDKIFEKKSDICGEPPKERTHLINELNKPYTIEKKEKAISGYIKQSTHNKAVKDLGPSQIDSPSPEVIGTRRTEHELEILCRQLARDEFIKNNISRLESEGKIKDERAREKAERLFSMVFAQYANMGEYPVANLSMDIYSPRPEFIGTRRIEGSGNNIPLVKPKEVKFGQSPLTSGLASKNKREYIAKKMNELDHDLSRYHPDEIGINEYGDLVPVIIGHVAGNLTGDNTSTTNYLHSIKDTLQIADRENTSKVYGGFIRGGVFVAPAFDKNIGFSVFSKKLKEMFEKDPQGLETYLLQEYRRLVYEGIPDDISDSRLVKEYYSERAKNPEHALEELAYVIYKHKFYRAMLNNMDPNDREINRMQDNKLGQRSVMPAGDYPDIDEIKALEIYNKLNSKYKGLIKDENGALLFRMAVMDVRGVNKEMYDFSGMEKKNNLSFQEWKSQYISPDNNQIINDGVIFTNSIGLRTLNEICGFESSTADEFSSANKSNLKPNTSCIIHYTEGGDPFFAKFTVHNTHPEDELNIAMNNNFMFIANPGAIKVNKGYPIWNGIEPLDMQKHGILIPIKDIKSILKRHNYEAGDLVSSFNRIISGTSAFRTDELNIYNNALKEMGYPGDFTELRVQLEKEICEERYNEIQNTLNDLYGNNPDKFSKAIENVKRAAYYDDEMLNLIENIPCPAYIKSSEGRQITAKYIQMAVKEILEGRQQGFNAIITPGRKANIEASIFNKTVFDKMEIKDVKAATDFGEYLYKYRNCLEIPPKAELQLIAEYDRLIGCTRYKSAASRSHRDKANKSSADRFDSDEYDTTEYAEKIKLIKEWIDEAKRRIKANMDEHGYLKEGSIISSDLFASANLSAAADLYSKFISSDIIGTGPNVTRINPPHSNINGKDGAICIKLPAETPEHISSTNYIGISTVNNGAVIEPANFVNFETGNTGDEYDMDITSHLLINTPLMRIVYELIKRTHKEIKQLKQGMQGLNEYNFHNEVSKITGLPIRESLLNGFIRSDPNSIFDSFATLANFADKDSLGDITGATEFINALQETGYKNNGIDPFRPGSIIRDPDIIGTYLGFNGQLRANAFDKASHTNAYRFSLPVFLKNMLIENIPGRLIHKYYSYIDMLRLNKGQKDEEIKTFEEFYQILKEAGEYEKFLINYSNGDPSTLGRFTENTFNLESLNITNPDKFLGKLQFDLQRSPEYIRLKTAASIKIPQFNSEAEKEFRKQAWNLCLMEYGIDKKYLMPLVVRGLLAGGGSILIGSLPLDNNMEDMAAQELYTYKIGLVFSDGNFKGSRCHKLINIREMFDKLKSDRLGIRYKHGSVNYRDNLLILPTLNEYYKDWIKKIYYANKMDGVNGKDINKILEDMDAECNGIFIRVRYNIDKINKDNNGNEIASIRWMPAMDSDTYGSGFFNKENENGYIRWFGLKDNLQASRDSQTRFRLFEKIHYNFFNQEQIRNHVYNWVKSRCHPDDMGVNPDKVYKIRLALSLLDPKNTKGIPAGSLAQFVSNDVYLNFFRKFEELLPKAIVDKDGNIINLNTIIPYGLDNPTMVSIARYAMMNSGKYLPCINRERNGLNTELFKDMPSDIVKLVGEVVRSNDAAEQKIKLNKILDIISQGENNGYIRTLRSIINAEENNKMYGIQRFDISLSFINNVLGAAFYAKKAIDIYNKKMKDSIFAEFKEWMAPLKFVWYFSKPRWARRNNEAAEILFSNPFNESIIASKSSYSTMTGMLLPSGSNENTYTGTGLTSDTLHWWNLFYKNTNNIISLIRLILFEINYKAAPVVEKISLIMNDMIGNQIKFNYDGSISFVTDNSSKGKEDFASKNKLTVVRKDARLNSGNINERFNIIPVFNKLAKPLFHHDMNTIFQPDIEIKVDEKQLELLSRKIADYLRFNGLTAKFSNATGEPVTEQDIINAIGKSVLTRAALKIYELGLRHTIGALRGYAESMRNKDITVDTGDAVTKLNNAIKEIKYILQGAGPYDGFVNKINSVLIRPMIDIMIDVLDRNSHLDNRLAIDGMKCIFMQVISSGLPKEAAGDSDIKTINILDKFRKLKNLYKKVNAFLPEDEKERMNKIFDIDENSPLYFNKVAGFISEMHQSCASMEGTGGKGLYSYFMNKMVTGSPAELTGFSKNAKIKFWPLIPYNDNLVDPKIKVLLENELRVLTGEKGDLDILKPKGDFRDGALLGRPLYLFGRNTNSKFAKLIDGFINANTEHIYNILNKPLTDEIAKGKIPFYMPNEKGKLKTYYANSNTKALQRWKWMLASSIGSTIVFNIIFYTKYSKKENYVRNK